MKKMAQSSMSEVTCLVTCIPFEAVCISTPPLIGEYKTANELTFSITADATKMYIFCCRRPSCTAQTIGCHQATLHAYSDNAHMHFFGVSGRLFILMQSVFYRIVCASTVVCSHVHCSVSSSNAPPLLPFGSHLSLLQRCMFLSYNMVLRSL